MECYWVNPNSSTTSMVSSGVQSLVKYEDTIKTPQLLYYNHIHNMKSITTPMKYVDNLWDLNVR